MKPVVDQVLQNMPDRIMPLLFAAVATIKTDLAVASGNDVDDADALLAIIYRLTQRVATLESEIRLIAYR